MTLTLVTPPAVSAVPVTELADHLRLAEGYGEPLAEEASVHRVLDAATATVERALSTALIRQTWRWRDVRPPSPLMPITPVLSIDNVVRRRGDETMILPTSAYQQTGDRVCIADARTDDRYEITFTAGLGDDWNTVPGDLRQAILLLAAHFFERRHASDETSLKDLPHGVDRLLASHRTVRL